MKVFLENLMQIFDGKYVAVLVFEIYFINDSRVCDSISVFVYVYTKVCVVYHRYVWVTHGGQMTGSDLPALELQEAVNR